jgi:MarR family transcriptional regulator, organic hydroperoxide resistance regulator
MDVANRLFLRLYQVSSLLHKTGTRAVSKFAARSRW